MAIRNRAAVEHHREALRKAEENYQRRVSAVRKQHSEQPEYEDRWLPELKVKLERRKEGAAFDVFQRAHAELKTEVLGCDLEEKTAPPVLSEKREAKAPVVISELSENEARGAIRELSEGVAAKAPAATSSEPPGSRAVGCVEPEIENRKEMTVDAPKKSLDP